jgi:hypothetical protein
MLSSFKPQNSVRHGCRTTTPWLDASCQLPTLLTTSQPSYRRTLAKIKPQFVANATVDTCQPYRHAAPVTSPAIDALYLAGIVELQRLRLRTARTSADDSLKSNVVLTCI